MCRSLLVNKSICNNRTGYIRIMSKKLVNEITKAFYVFMDVRLLVYVEKLPKQMVMFIPIEPSIDGSTEIRP